MEGGELLLQVPGTGTAPRIEVMDPAIERRLRAFVAERENRPVRIAESKDVEGHMAAAADSAVVRIILEDEDDTEGHAISLRFPDAESARQFRTRLAAGVLVGALAVAGAGAAARVAPSFGSSAGVDAAGGTSITLPNVHADQAIAPAGGISAPTSVHSDQAIAPAGGISAPTSVHSDQAIAPAGGISAPTSVHSDQAIAPAVGQSAPTSVHSDQAIAPEAGTVPNVHSDQAVPDEESSDSDSRLPRGNEVR
jgi:hypothetical protein